MQKIMPTATETPKAMTTEEEVTMVFHSAVRAMSQARKKPKAMPKSPPPKEMRTDSVRNWRTISKRRAPMEGGRPDSGGGLLPGGGAVRERPVAAARGAESTNRTPTLQQTVTSRCQ